LCRWGGGLVTKRVFAWLNVDSSPSKLYDLMRRLFYPADTPAVDALIDQPAVMDVDQCDVVPEKQAPQFL
jgi:hypothetical protein